LHRNESIDGRGIRGSGGARAHRFSDAALESESQGQHGITHRGSIAIERSRVVDPTLFGRHGRNACAV